MGGDAARFLLLHHHLAALGADVDGHIKFWPQLETEKGLEEGINPYRRNAEQVIHEGFRLNPLFAAPPPPRRARC